MYDCKIANAKLFPLIETHIQWVSTSITQASDSLFPKKALELAGNSMSWQGCIYDSVFSPILLNPQQTFKDYIITFCTCAVKRPSHVMYSGLNF